MRTVLYPTLTVFAAFALIAVPGMNPTPMFAQEKDAAKEIAAEAWIYAYPMLFNYKSLYEQTQEASHSNYIGGFNKFRHYARVFTPKDTTIVTPNNDTPYSWAWLDLRTEPVVLSVPDVPDDRYYVVQGIDLFTYNFAYVGSRATGNKAGKYLFAGPDWKGETPKGIDKVFQAETQLILFLMRVQLKSPTDMKNVEAIQAGMKLEPLSVFAGAAVAPASSKVEWQKWDSAKATSFEFVGYLNFLLQFSKAHPSEKELLARFATIGIGPGLPFDTAKLPDTQLAALKDGAALGKTRLVEKEKTTLSSLGLFGNREEMKNDYTTRAVAAAKGLYGNSVEEAVYTGSDRDGEGEPLDGSKHKYVLTFAPDKIPPAKFFWSATMYRLPERLLVENPIDRYSLGSATEGFKPAADGSITIYIQVDTPEGDKKANWLPAPKGRFDIVLRMYGPSKDAQTGKWTMPKIERAK
jgi:hypothetical protein